MSSCWDAGDATAAEMDAAGRCSPGQDGSYVCGWEGCQLQLDSQQQLVEHVTVQHVQLASGSYRCLWRGCSRRRQGFNARYKMFVHIRTHTKERPHVCADCGKGFSRQENLKIHKRTHTGEKPYSCTFEGCDRAYSNSSDRFKHTRTHYTDRPYACRFPGCVKSYTDPSSLRKHMKSNGHHRQQDTPPTPSETPIGKARKHDRDSCRQMVLGEGGEGAAETAAVPAASRDSAECGCRSGAMKWDPWLWYPWVQHVEQILCAHAQTDHTAQAGVEAEGRFAPAPLDLRLLPS